MHQNLFVSYYSHQFSLKKKKQDNHHLDALSRIVETIVAHSEGLRGAFDCWTELVNESDKHIPGTDVTFKQIAERLPSLMAVPPFKSKPLKEKKTAPESSPATITPQPQPVQAPVVAAQTTTPTPTIVSAPTPQNMDPQIQQAPTTQPHTDQQTQQQDHPAVNQENGFRSQRRGGPRRYPNQQGQGERRQYQYRQQQSGDQQQADQQQYQPRHYGGGQRRGGGRNFNNKNNTNTNNISSHNSIPQHN